MKVITGIKINGKGSMNSMKWIGKIQRSTSNGMIKTRSHTLMPEINGYMPLTCSRRQRFIYIYILTNF